MKTLLARTITIAAMSLGVVATASAQLRLNSMPSVGGSLALSDDDTILFRGVASPPHGGLWSTDGPNWAFTKVIGQTFGGQPVWDAPRHRFVGKVQGGIGSLTWNSNTKSWSSSLVPNYVYTYHGSIGEVTVDTRNLNPDPKAARIYWRSGNSYSTLYVLEYAKGHNTDKYGWRTNIVTNVPGGAPVFDNYNPDMTEEALFFRGYDSRLYRSIRNNNTHGWYTSVVGTDQGNWADVPIVNANNSVVYRDSGGRIASTWWNGSTWLSSTWTPSANVSFTDTIRRGSHPGIVYYTGTDNNIWRCAWGGSNFVTTKMTTAANAYPRTLVVNTLNEVFYRGTDNCLWRAY